MNRPTVKRISRNLVVVIAIGLATIFSIYLTAPSAAGPAIGEGRAMASPDVACTQAPAGQIALYTADNTAADAQGGHNGRLQNGAAYGAGKVGSAAFTFDGVNDYVEVADAADLHPQTFTLEAWVNFSSFTNNLEVIVGKSSSACDCDNSFALHYDPISHTLRSYSGNSQSYPQLAVPFTPVLADWYHIAQTYDGAKQEMYINGVLSGTYNGTLNISYDSNEMTIGAERVNGQTLYPLSGSIDGLSIYNRALSQPEIQSIYQAGSFGKCTPPSISEIDDQSTNGDTPTGAISFTIGDAETPVGSLSVSGSSSNTTLVPGANIAFGGADANRTVTVTPAANRSGRAAITVTVADAEGNTKSESFLLTVRTNGGAEPSAVLNFETVRNVNIQGCNLYVTLNGFGYDPQNHPALGWSEASSCGGPSPLRWSRFESSAWVERTITGTRAEPADFELRQDGAPFYAYAFPDAYIFGSTWYTAHFVNLEAEPNGHGSQVRAIESYQSCIAASPWFAIDFAPGAQSPDLALGTRCSQSAWLALNGSAVQGSPPFTSTAGDSGDFSNIDYASGPGNSHHLSYYADRGTRGRGAYYSNGSSGNETLLAIPHQNRGAETSVAVAPDGRIHVAVGGVPLCGNDFEGGLLYLTSTDGVNWERTFVDRVSGRSPSLELNTAGRPRIAYYGFDNEVRYAALEDGAWKTVRMFVQPTPAKSVRLKLAFDANDEPHIVFFKQTSASDGDIQISSGMAANLPPAVINPGDQTSAPGATVTLQINATDDTPSALNYSACGLPPGLSINPTTGLVSGTVSSSEPAGSTYDVSIFVADGDNSTAIKFKWTLANNNQPSLTNPGDRTNAEGDTVSLQLAATDADGDVLTYSATGLPPGLTLDPSSGLISGSLDFNSAGSYAVAVNVSDGSLTDVESFTWTVTNTNRAPLASNAAAQTNEDTSINIQLAGSDADADVLSFAVVVSPAHGTLMISNNAAAYTPAHNFNGADSFTFKANDGVVDSNIATVSITVAPVNDPPTVTRPPDQTNIEGTSPSLQISASDPDGDALSYSALHLPPGLSINSTTGLITGSLGLNSAGVYHVMISVFDGRLTNGTGFIWTVTDAVTPAPCASPGLAPAGTFSAGSSPESVAVADFNNDGRQDLAVCNNLSSGKVTLLPAGPSGSFVTGSTPVPVQSKPENIVAADLNGDGKADFAVVNQASDSVSVRLGDGTGSFTESPGPTPSSTPGEFHVGDRPTHIVGGDFNQDGRLDLVTANIGTNNVSLLPGLGNGSFSAAFSFAVGSSPRYLAVGDLDRDGRLDLVVSNQVSGSISILRNTTAPSQPPSFTVANIPAHVSGLHPIVVRDFNGDGKLDIAAAGQSDDKVAVFFGDGGGAFGAPNVIEIRTGFSDSLDDMVAADFNHDGKLDLAIVCVATDLVVILRNDGTGAFPTQFTLSTGDAPEAIAVGDFNHDGVQDDLVTINSSSGNVSIFINTCPPLFGDGDGDGVRTDIDNCPLAPNADQKDTDHDGAGDVCDADDDGDGIADTSDNCQLTSNNDQADTDADGIGDACDPDDDNDGRLDAIDNCPLVANIDQQDSDNDGVGDACDPDDDNDGVADGVDNCSLTANSNQADNDRDGIGNACDPDDDNDGDADTIDCAPLNPATNHSALEVCDGFDNNCNGQIDEGFTDTDNDTQADCVDNDDDDDGVLDTTDNCRLIANADQTDTDNDSLGNECDSDDDGDGDPDTTDCAPLNAAINHTAVEVCEGIDNDCDGYVDEGFTDTDHDGQADCVDNDDDNDTVPDRTDNCPLSANTDQSDNDHDGAGDACDNDDDNDGVTDAMDNCPLIGNSDQADNDDDGSGDACDADDDNDGVPDVTDNCPFTSNSDQADSDHDRIGDTCDMDDDNDGVPDTSDNCRLVANPNQADSDHDGKGDVCDTDDDNDGVADATDNCPFTANPGQNDNDHDGVGDVCDSDDDNDGLVDTSDNCVFVANPGQTDTDHDGAGDACDSDDDNDAVPDATDNCPLVANPGQNDNDHDGIGDACEPDDDNDGVPDTTDNCPLMANPNQTDTDNDGTGDACDPATEACFIVDFREITYFKNNQVLTSSDAVIRANNGIPGAFNPSLWPYNPAGGNNYTRSRGTLFRIYGFKPSVVGAAIHDADNANVYIVTADPQISGTFYIQLNGPARVIICPSQIQTNFIANNEKLKDWTLPGSVALSDSQLNVPGIMLNHNVARIEIPKQVRDELTAMGMPLLKPNGSEAQNGLVDYLGFQLWGHGNADFKEFVNVEIKFIYDSANDRARHYQFGFHTAKNGDMETFAGCSYVDRTPGNDTVRFNDVWARNKEGNPNWGPACGQLEPNQNQKVRENYTMPFNGIQILPTVNTNDDSLRILVGRIRPTN